MSRYIIPAAKACRVSSTKISSVNSGKGTTGKWNWKKSVPKVKPLHQQLVIDPACARGYRFVTISNIHRKEDGRVYGTWCGNPMVRDGYAYGMSKNGHTPGRWVKAS